MPVSDFKIVSTIRSALTKRWIDLHKLRVAAFRGTIRLSGELRRIGHHEWTKANPPRLETLELDLKRIQGVRRVFFELTNFRRNEAGQWVMVDRAKQERSPVEERLFGSAAVDGKKTDQRKNATSTAGEENQ